jgi:hypothetical protein
MKLNSSFDLAAAYSGLRLAEDGVWYADGNEAYFSQPTDKAQLEGN